MKNLILTLGSLVVVVVLVSILVALESVVAFVIKDLTKVAENVTCNVKVINTDNGNVTLKLDCSGKEASTANALVVVSYVQNPGPLICTTYKSGSVSCEPRKK